MQELSYYNPITLTEDEKNELRELLTESYKALKRSAVENYGDKGGIRRLRDDYKNGRLTLLYDPRARSFLDRLIALEQRVVSVYIRLGVKLCRKFHRCRKDRPGVTIGDYLQICAWAIYDAMYLYNGKTKFSTYCRWAMKNRLINFVRDDEQASGVGQTVGSLRLKIKKLMLRFGYSFDESLELIRGETTISDYIASSLKDSFYKVRHVVEEDAVCYSFLEEQDESAELVQIALRQARLTPLERELIDAFIYGDRKHRKMMAEQRINPKTNRLYTRQSLSQTFLRACRKVRAAYERLEKRAA